MEHLVQILTYFVVVSVAAERSTEIIKQLFLKKLTSNAGVYQGLSALFGAGLAYLSPPSSDLLHLPQWAVILVVGLAVSGGSGVWNNLLDILAEYRKGVKATYTAQQN